MNAQRAIQLGIVGSEMIYMQYLSDLTDADMMRRPDPGCNHINWQVGHLIAAEHELIEMVKPGSMPALPAGFKEQYAKETATSDDPAAFRTKEELLQTYREQRAGTLAALEKTTDDELELPTPLEYVPNVAAMFSLQASHWLMHSGQWVIVRRQLGRPPLM